jgi:hypothetical protein
MVHDDFGKCDGRQSRPRSSTTQLGTAGAGTSAGIWACVTCHMDLLRQWLADDDDGAGGSAPSSLDCSVPQQLMSGLRALMDAALLCHPRDDHFRNSWAPTQ